MKLEVFFDYACPFSRRGHEDLLELLPDFPEVEVTWRPCEAHQRPDHFGLHSDLCARGMYVAQAHGADLMAYHRRMYQASLTDLRNIEDVDVLADVVGGLMDAAVFRDALHSAAYTDELAANNRACWSEHRFVAVPSHVLGKETLRSDEGVGLTAERIRQFLAQAKAL